MVSGYGSIGTLGSMFSLPQSAVCTCGFKLENALLTTSPYLFQFSGGVQKPVQIHYLS